MVMSMLEFSGSSVFNSALTQFEPALKDLMTSDGPASALARVWIHTFDHIWVKYGEVWVWWTSWQIFDENLSSSQRDSHFYPKFAGLMTCCRSHTWIPTWPTQMGWLGNFPSFPCCSPVISSQHQLGLGIFFKFTWPLQKLLEFGRTLSMESFQQLLVLSYNRS